MSTTQLIQDDDFSEKFNSVVKAFKQKTVTGAFDIAMRTALLTRQLVGIIQLNSMEDLVNMIKTFGKELMASDPSESSVGNIIRRVLKFVREEDSGSFGKDAEGEWKGEFNNQKDFVILFLFFLLPELLSRWLYVSMTVWRL